jgi:uncharacterized protein
MKQNNENTNAFLIHISAFAGFIFPFGNIITPLIAWQTLKDRSSFLDAHGKEAINFNISYSLYILLLSMSMIPFFIGSVLNSLNRFGNFNHLNIDFDTHHIFGFFGFFSLAGILGLVKIALIIIAALKAKEGESYAYPFTIKFIK